jgi:hypothetical protein
MSANNDELVAPGWLNSEFLEGVLKKYKNNESLSVRKMQSAKMTFNKNVIKNRISF